MILIVIAMYILMPFLSIPIILMGLMIDKKNTKFYTVMIVFTLALLGYHYVPSETNDMFRYYIQMNHFQLYSISEIKHYISNHDPLMVKVIILYLISLTGNYNLLPLLSTFIVYFIFINNFIDYSKRNSLNHYMTAGLILFIISWFSLTGPISGFRQWLSFALFFNGIYREFILNRKGLYTISLYIIPLFLHNSILLLLCVRLLLTIFKKMNYLVIIILLTWGILYEQIIKILSRINSSYFQSITDKAELYVDYSINNSYRILNLFIYIFFITLIMLMYYLTKKYQRKYYEKYLYFYRFGLFMSIICIGGIPYSSVILNRFSIFSIIFIPYFLITLYDLNSVRKYKYLFLVSIPSLSIIGIYLKQYIVLRWYNYDISNLELLSSNLFWLLF